jgi:hypothetical protein
MPKQFENSEAIKIEKETAPNVTPQKRIEGVAEDAAKKSTATVQVYDKENSAIFTK